MTVGRSKHVVTTAARPDLISVVADWIWRAFWKPHGHGIEEVRALVTASKALIGPPQCFVLLVDGEPVGTASLVASDLDSRPDLTPWLAALYVRPEARGANYALDLIRAVEQAAEVAGYRTLWLYTLSAEGLYRKAGWQAVKRFQRPTGLAVLMRRSLDGARGSS